MLKVRTTRDAKGPEAVKARPTTTADITKRQVSARTVHNIRRGHLVRGIRDVNHIGWKQWEQTVAETLRMAEEQRLSYANRHYDALERSQGLLAVVGRRSRELQATVEELDAANEELQATNEEMEAANEELQATTEELESANAYRQTLMDSMLDILMTTDPKGIITEVNRATERISGYNREELVGQPLPRFFTDPERAQAGIEKVLAEGGVSNYELTVITKDGRETPVSYNATALRTRRGRITGVLGSARDITESKRAEEELARSNAELEQFAYVASHDLQEPLRKIQAFGDRLETKYGEALTDEGSDYLQRMQNAAERMQTLINSLLAFSRVTSRGEPFVSVNLAEVAQQVVADLSVSIERTGGRVEVGELPIIDADPTQMRQLLQNLIGNGLKFHKEEEAPAVKVYSKPLDEVCQIIVEDNGIGFDKKHLDRIFTIFQRLHSRSEYEGTGVGLAICRKIAERHSGNITAKSKPGEGATFVVTLPVKQDVRRQTSNVRCET
jgi:PAS domain S-box-containing protein